MLPFEHYSSAVTVAVCWQGNTSGTGAPATFCCWMTAHWLASRRSLNIIWATLSTISQWRGARSWLLTGPSLTPS